MEKLRFSWSLIKSDETLKFMRPYFLWVLRKNSLFINYIYFIFIGLNSFYDISEIKSNLHDGMLIVAADMLCIHTFLLYNIFVLEECGLSYGNCAQSQLYLCRVKRQIKSN